MNKFLKSAVIAVMCCSMVLSVYATGCGGEKDPDDNTNIGGDDGSNDNSTSTTPTTYNPETRVLSLSTGALDGNFNPFFYTAANDGNILSNTQIGMLTSDENGQLVCGEDQACVVLDYTTTMYDTKTVGTGSVTSVGSTDGRTEYEFVIKKGIKFSDGTELTIKDVLFNLYVYLDPAFTGSATIYSTDIQGLKAYRSQDSSMADDSDTDLDASFTAEAQARILNLINWSDDTKLDEADLTEQMENDLTTVKALFMEEATSDWNSNVDSWVSSYEDHYRFTEAWQAYLFSEGLIQYQTMKNSNGNTVYAFNDDNSNNTIDDEEYYYTTLDNDILTGNDPDASSIIQEIEDATSAENIAAYIAKHEGATEADAKLALQKEYCINLVYDNYTYKSNISQILTYWATASSALESFTGDARSEYYKNLKENYGKVVSTISGITTYKTSTFDGKDLGGEYDVLKIVINGVDPKAIYNFAFTVAPLHYYSGEYGGTNYVKLAEEDENNTYFGVELGDSNFFTQVLKDASKTALPVGAGPYKASTSRGADTTDGNAFFSNNIVYFKRNDYFTTLGSGIENAKINRINYKVLADDRIMDALTTGSIDFGMPNATPSNVSLVSQYAQLTSVTYQTGGYGYVGINPKFVPEVAVRQAIMKAMDTTQTVTYYGSLASLIYRPMSKTSWAYPEGATEYEDIKYATLDSEIEALVESAGYTKNKAGKYVKTSNVAGMTNAAIGTTLKFTFTIAGETTDHPAYRMFRDASDRLNDLGFDTSVQTDIQALKNLATGNLAVWAAAWSAGSDPDPYQIYHKDSKATSVNNWNYSNILADTSKWKYEYDIIYELSDYIDQGRQTLDQEERAGIYSTCLDLIMSLAVELPTYQRNDLCVYNNTVINKDTLVSNPSSNMGLFDKIWEINYV
jgi:peptide/nickel transport system substrate-binding protein